MLNPLKRVILQQLAKAYQAYTDEKLPADLKDWPSKRQVIYKGEGCHLIDECYDSKFMDSILDLLSEALCDDDHEAETCRQAQQGCLMFDELFKKDLNIQGSIKRVWNNYPVKIKQLEDGLSLGSILAARSAFPEPKPRKFTFEADPISTTSTEEKALNNVT